MKALIVLNDGGVDMEYSSTRNATNTFRNMGIEVEYIKAFGSNPTWRSAANMEQIIADMEIDLVYIGNINSGTITENQDMFRTGLSVPIFAYAGNYYNAGYSVGISGLHSSDTDGNSTATIMEIVETGGEIRSYGRTYILSASGVPIIQDPNDATRVSAWSHHNAGKKGSYWENAGLQQVSMLPLLMQAAINNGDLAAPPRKAQCPLTIDHISGASSGAIGFQLQPQNIQILGDILRATNGVCYASIEQGEVADVLLNTTLLANLQSYSDVFKYIACHDHHINSVGSLSNSGYTTRPTVVNDALTHEESEVNINASYDETVAAIESMGLQANTDFAHFATNAVGPTGLKVMAEKGFALSRASAFSDNREAYPSLPAYARSPAYNVTEYRGVRVLGSSIDAGVFNGVNDGSNVARGLDFQAMQTIFDFASNGRITYWHGAEFENPAVTEAPNYMRGVLAWQFGQRIQEYCEDTLDFGADLKNYYK